MQGLMYDQVAAIDRAIMGAQTGTLKPELDRRSPVRRGALHRALVHFPGGLSVLRLLAVPGVVWLAHHGVRRPWAATVAALIAIDLADGILARRIGDAVALARQRRLDGIADAALYAVAPVCAYWLRPELLRQERLPIALYLATQTSSLLACYARFGRLPRYHTSAYKWSAGILGMARAGRVAGGRLGLGFRPALALVALAHLEAVAITCLLGAYRQPVRTVWDVLRARRAVQDG